MKTAIKVLERELESLENRVKMGDLYPLVENYKLEIPEIKEAIRALKTLEAPQKSNFYGFIEVHRS